MMNELRCEMRVLNVRMQKKRTKATGIRRSAIFFISESAWTSGWQKVRATRLGNASVCNQRLECTRAQPIVIRLPQQYKYFYKSRVQLKKQTEVDWSGRWSCLPECKYNKWEKRLREIYIYLKWHFVNVKENEREYKRSGDICIHSQRDKDKCSARMAKNAELNAVDEQ